MPDQQDWQLQIDYHGDSAGWMECFFTLAGERYLLRISDVFPPFPQLMCFLRAIWAYRLPYHFYWDEEGRGALFEALPLEPSGSAFRLRVTYDHDGTTWVDQVVEREVLTEAIISGLQDFVRYAGPPSRGDWKLKQADLNEFEAFRQRGIAPRSQAKAEDMLSMHFAGSQMMESPVQWLEFIMWGIPMVSLVLPDASPFWRKWIGFLERILEDHLPAEVIFSNPDYDAFINNMVASGELPDAELNHTWFISLLAEPVHDPSLFRLTLTEVDTSKPAQLDLDEVLDRCEVARIFCREFDRYLKQEYRVIEEEDGTRFDLRTLPMDHLRSLLER